MNGLLKNISKLEKTLDLKKHPKKKQSELLFTSFSLKMPIEALKIIDDSRHAILIINKTDKDIEVIHNDVGPAIIYPNGDKRWYLYGVSLPQECYNQWFTNKISKPNYILSKEEEKYMYEILESNQTPGG